MSVLIEAVTLGEVADVFAQLPNDFGPLIEASVDIDADAAGLQCRKKERWQSSVLFFVCV